MKNLKNMLFAAAIGAVLIPVAVGAKNITADTTITSTNGSNYTEELVVKAGKTLTVNADASYGVVAAHCSDGTDKAQTACTDAGATWVAEAPATIGAVKLEKGAKLVNYSNANIVPTASGDNLILYYMEDTAKTYVADAELNLSDTDKAAKTVYYEAKEQEITIAAPEILGAYRTAKAGANYTVKDKKAVISKETAKAGAADITIVFTASDNDTNTITYTVKFLKKGEVNTVDNKKVTENQAAIDAIYADYISVMNNDKALAKKVFGVKGLTTAALTNAPLVFTVENVGTDTANATAKAAIEKVVSGLTKINDEITYFDVTATLGGQDITDISSTGKKFTVTVDTGLTDVVVPEGKALYVINYHVDNANTAANIVDKNAKLDEKGNLTFTTNQFSTFAVAIGDKVAETPATPAQTTDKDTKETNTGDATKEANPKTSDNVMTSVVSLLVSAFGLTAAGLKLKNN